MDQETNYYLSNWADLLDNDQYIDYEALIKSDDEWLTIESLLQVEEF